MLTIKQIETKAKLENLKQRLEYLDRDLLFKNITPKQYKKEQALISGELFVIEKENGIDLKEIFDEMMGKPQQEIESLIEQARKLSEVMM